MSGQSSRVILAHPVKLFEDRNSRVLVGEIPADTEFTVLSRRDGWVFVQADSGIEGWAQLDPRPGVPFGIAAGALATALVLAGAVLTWPRVSPAADRAVAAFVNTPVPTPTPVPPTPTPIPFCATSDGRKVYDLLSQYATEWDDAVKLANSTPRIQIATPIADLQRIRRMVSAQSWPSCGAHAQALLVLGMDSMINAFLAFSANKPDSEVSFETQWSERVLDLFKDELQRVSSNGSLPPASPEQELVYVADGRHAPPDDSVVVDMRSRLQKVAAQCVALNPQRASELILADHETLIDQGSTTPITTMLQNMSQSGQVLTC